MSGYTTARGTLLASFSSREYVADGLYRVARYVVDLMEQNEDVTQEEAYNHACRLFYDTMSFVQTERRVALESLLHFGASYPLKTEETMSTEEKMQQRFADEQAALKERWTTVESI